MTSVFIADRPRVLALLLGMCACAAALAGKPDWAGKGGKHGPQDESRQEAHAGVDVPIGVYFGEPQRLAAQRYYGGQYSPQHCPPGLAKKNNGCQPPGQAKKWALGKPLSSSVVLYPVPKAVVVQIGAAPAGHRYVRVANDILLIAIGTSIVVDAIEDLMKP